MIALEYSRERMLCEVGIGAGALPAVAHEWPGEDELASEAELHVLLKRKTPDEILPQLGVALSRRFADVPLPELERNLLAPLKKAIGNAHKRGNRLDPDKWITVELVLARAGAFVEVCDQGAGFDVAGALEKLRAGQRYFAHHGSGLRKFTKADSVISFATGGSTFRVRFLAAGEKDAALAMIELPFRSEIESLDTVLDPGTMLGVFRDVLAATTGPQLSAVGVRILRYQPGREHAVVEYRLLADGCELDVCIGKVFAKRRRARRLQRALDAAWAHLGQRTPAPVPLAFLEQHALVLMRRLVGVPLVPILVAEDAAAAEAASRLAAQSLVALHSVPIEEGKPGSFEDELANVRKHIEDYRRGAPALLAQGEQLLADIEALARALPQPGAPALIHGSFRPTEVLIGAGKAYLFDLDGWALGDRALDLGYYLADVWWESHKSGELAIRPWSERLLEHYLEQADAPGLRERARLYEAFAHTRVMLKKLRALVRDEEKHATNHELAEQLRDRAQSRLALATA